MLTISILTITRGTKRHGVQGGQLVSDLSYVTASVVLPSSGGPCLGCTTPIKYRIVF